MTDTVFGLSLFHEDLEEAKVIFDRYMKEDEETSCLDIGQDSRRVTDMEAQDILQKLCGTKSASDFQGIDKARRDRSIAMLKASSLSIRQISRLTGISFGIVRKI